MKKNKMIIMTALFLFLFSGCQPQSPSNNGEEDNANAQITKKEDDWAFKPETLNVDEARFGSRKMFTNSAPAGFAPPSALFDASDSLGFAVGGAKDINNFRENIKNGFLPLFTDLTYEGLFYNYYFDIGSEKKECTKLFCPTYSTAITKDPLSQEEEYYMTVGLDSGMTESDFSRKKLNIVVVLDISGSMGSPFDQYYYDQTGKREEKDDADLENKSKMEVANEAVIALLDHLNPEDRFGMVLYDDDAYLAKPMKKVLATDMDAIKEHIMELQEAGGTNMEAGYKMGTDLFKEFLSGDPGEYENRIIFLTDAQPNSGRIDDESLIGMTKKNAEKKINTTFIGIGVDFNTELIEMITKARGANYYSVHSGKDFKRRMDDEFDFMVTPLAYNVELKLNSKGYAIEKVYGSPEADESTGELLKINTLFPSKTEEGEVKGGIVLVKLKKTSPEDTKIELIASYEDRNGKADHLANIIHFDSKKGEWFENTGIQKGILLTRYANLIKNWIIDERDHYSENEKPVFYQPRICDGMSRGEYRCGIIPPPLEYKSGKWERKSIKLAVSAEYAELFEKFEKYFDTEMKSIGDENLKEELETIKRLLDTETQNRI